jgi:hypothetical protein
MAEAWALGMRRVEGLGGAFGWVGGEVRRVNARAPSSPVVVTRVVVGLRVVVVRDLMVFWWRGVRDCHVSVDEGGSVVSEGLW